MSQGLAHSLADPVRVLGKEEGAGSAQLCSSPQALSALKSQTEAIPCVVGDEEVWTSDVQYQLSVSPAWGRARLSLLPGSVCEAAPGSHPMCS